MARLARFRKGIADAFSGPPVVFHHVPKCGGTSIERALRLRYPMSYATFPLRPLYDSVHALHPTYNETQLDDATAYIREVELLSYLHQGINCIAGHVYFSETAYKLFGEKYKFVTVLRDPVEFFRSFYFHMVRSDVARWKVDKSIEEFMDTPLARLFGRYYVLYFSELVAADRDISPDAVSRAKSTLQKFTVVGLVEDMAKFERKLRSVLDIRLHIGHANKTRTRFESCGGIITPAIRRRIEELSAPNIEIYEFAKRELAK